MMASVPMTIPSGRVHSPWMGIPIPGELPIVLLTKQVIGALKGVTVTDAAVRYRTLEVTYTHGRRGHGRCVFYDRGNGCTRLDIHRDIHRWAEKQREILAKPKPVKLSDREAEIARQIRRLEKEKRSLYLSPDPPVHPFLHRREQRWVVGQMPDQTCADYIRESEQRWHDEKPKRKELARIAGLWLKNKLTSTTAYKALREAGWEVTPVSKLRTHDRERRPYQDDYWKHLPEFVRGVLAKVAREKDYEHDANEDGTPSTEFTRHARARLEYLATRRHAQMIDKQIKALREMAAPVPVLELTEPPEDWEWEA
jgi:hypothetical protein